jgi:antitoxin component YwqK of YwqJK toxin-antitoxin module
MRYFVYFFLLFFCFNIYAETTAILKDDETTFFENGKQIALWKYSNNNEVVRSGENINGLVKRKRIKGNEELFSDVIYKNNIPIDQTVNTYSKKGKLLMETPFKNGKYNGVFKWYDPQKGYLSGEQEYQDDILSGFTKTYYENGQLSSLGKNKNGSLNGKYTKYFETGKIQSVVNYKNGYLFGKSIEYFENGKPHYKFKMKNGKMHGLITTYYDDGVKAQEDFYYDGVRMGITKVYDKNGKIIHTQENSKQGIGLLFKYIETLMF